MPFNGSGTFTRIYNWVMDKNQNVKITASRFDNEDDNFASGLSNCITKDGQTVITQDIPFNSKKITGLASGINIDHAINLGQLQNNQFLYLGTTGGSADAYTLSPNPSITSYATTQQFTVKINASNLTTTPYLQISGIANPSSTAVIKKLNAIKTEVALEISDLLANGIYKFQRNSTNNAWIVLDPEKPFYNIFNASPATATIKGVVYLPQNITIANNASSPNDTIDFGAGTYITLTGNQIYLPAISKKIQASGSWTAGTGQNGLDTGARAASRFYRTYVVQNNSTLAYDIVFSVSYLSPTIPSGYTNLGLLDYALIRVNGSNNIATAKWDANNKQLVLGPSEIIQVFSSLASSGSAQVLITTEPLEMQIRVSLVTGNAGASDILVWGSEHNENDSFDTVQAITNNGFATSIGFSPIYTSNGTIYWKNFSTAGGILNQTCKLKSIKIRS
jgi:hypothetical protein